jgi:hypothetical protein
MRLTLGLLADAANATADNKLNILGEFNIVNATQFPCVVPSMSLVFRLEATGNEADHHTFHVRLLDDDNNLVRPLIDGEFTLPPLAHQPGVPRRIQGVFPIGMAVFDRPGTYTFDVLVDNERPEAMSAIEVHIVDTRPE